jgi:hypothetical protein
VLTSKLRHYRPKIGVKICRRFWYTTPIIRIPHCESEIVWRNVSRARGLSATIEPTINKIGVAVLDYWD